MVIGQWGWSLGIVMGIGLGNGVLRIGFGIRMGIECTCIRLLEFESGAAWC